MERIGQTPEKAHVFGWANVAADLWKVTGLIVITSLWRAQQQRFALSLAPIWVLCLLWGLAGAIGIYAQDRTAVIGGREAVAATYKDKEHELEEIDTKLRTLNTQRSVTQVDAAIAAVLARPIMNGERVRGTVGKLSTNCTKEDRSTAESCQEVAALREERAAADAAGNLEARKSSLRAQIAKLREGGGLLAADPVAELFAWLSRGQLSVPHEFRKGSARTSFVPWCADFVPAGLRRAPCCAAVVVVVTAPGPAALGPWVG